MSQYQRILCFVEPGMRHSPGLQRAVQLARKSGAALHLSLIDYDLPLSRLLAAEPKRTEPALEQFLSRRRAWLADESQAFLSDGVRVTSQVTWAARRHVEMLSQIAEYRPDLVIKDSHHEPLLGRLLLRPLDWRLLGDADAPLMLVGRIRHALPRRILIAVDVADPPERRDAVLKAGLGLAIQCQSELHLAYVFEVVPAVVVGDAALAYFDYLLPDRRKAFEALADTHGVPADRRHFLLGAPGACLAELGENLDCDVLVIGAMKPPAGQRPLLGDTAERLLELSPCDVLAVNLP